MNKIDLYPGQRKSCRAVATISKGNGKVRINNIPVEILEPEVVKELILTPLTRSRRIKKQGLISMSTVARWRCYGTSIC